MPDLPKNQHNPGHARPADNAPGVGVKADNGIKVTVLPSVPPGRIVGGAGPSAALPRDVTVGSPASQTFGQGLPKNVNQ